MSDLATPPLWPTATVEIRLAFLRKLIDPSWIPNRLYQTLSTLS